MSPLKKYFSSYWIRSAFYTFLQRFSLTIFGLVNFMVLIDSLTHEQMGTWALFLTVTTIFEVSKGNLLKNAHIKYVSSGNNDGEKTGIASSSLLLNCLLTLLFILLVLLFSEHLSAWLNAGSDLALMLKWFIPGMICMVFFSHLEAVQQSHLDFKGVFAGYFIRQVAFFGVIMAHMIFRIPFSLAHLALYQSASILLGTAVLYFYSRKYLQLRFNPSTAWVKKILGYGGYIFGSGFMANLFANLDQVMTAVFMTPTSVSFYNAASRINALVDVPSYAAAEILFPKVSRVSVEEGNDRVRYLYERMVAILLTITIPASLFIMLFPRFVITVLAKPEYHPAALILQLYMVTGVMRPMQNQAANLLNSIGKQALCFTVNTVSLAANLAINYICLVQFGFYGAAIGTLITYLLGTLTWYFIMKRLIGIQLTRIFRYIIETYKLFYTHAAGLLLKTKGAHA